MEEELCRDIIKKMLNLKDLDVVVYKNLLRQRRKVKVNDLSHIVGRDRSTVQRSLNRLVKAGLCRKEKRIMRNGGYYYIYSVKEAEEIRDIIEKCLEEWYTKIKTKLLEGEEFLS
ncbi:MAG: ArsR family transcriptional regulator [Thermoplasmata archaeon]|nr:ArsR family transcriptional regulator [Thermoplasmata archaeon]